MRLLLALFFSLSLTVSFAQIYNPVKWKTEYRQVSENEFDLIFKATIEDGWTIYSQYLESDDGPIRTSFSYDKGTHYELVGKNKESDNRVKKHDKVFDMELIKFYNHAQFTQRVKITDLSKPIIGFLEFMSCDATKCLPPSQIDFEFNLKNTMSSGATGQAETPPAPKQKATPAPQKVEKKTSRNQKDLSLSSGGNAGAGGNNKKQTQPATSSIQKTEKKAVEKKIEKAKESVAQNIPTEITTPASSNGQPSGFIEPAKFSTVVKKINDTDVELIFNAKIDEGWYLYSQFQESDDGPMPTAFTYDEGEHYELVGKAKESSNLKKVYDKVFGMDVNKFAHNATFTQRIKIKDTSKPVTGYFEFQTCDDAKCIASALDVFLDTKTMEAFVGKTATEKIATANGDDNSSTTASATDVPSAYPSELVSVNMDNPAKKCNDTEEEESTIWGIFLLGLLGGLVALLTPCVFPMIPLTVSFFTKSAGNKSKGIRDAVLYGAFIFAVYLILSIPFHVMDSVNPDILNDISTNVYLNIAFFVIFLFFAFSFFGYYELTLPQSWTNKASSAEGTGGILGIFFMALTLALVSFSCTGPILGSLLAGALSSDGGAWQLTAGMGGFGLALALPFALFAAFPKWMNALPQSGGWLTTVKVVLGFLELALALKFFSNADMVAHWGILRYELFMGIWVVIFIGLGLYLFGKIKFPHDSPIQKLSPIRMGLGALSFAFVLYLLTGFMQNKETGTFTSKSLLSGLAPPVCYCWTYPCDCPGNLDCFKDIQAGWAYAKKNKKPILLDFTGYACVNCRKMEEHVWPVKKVDKFLKNDYVLISLYVDDKKALPEEEQITVQKPKELGGGTRKLRTYGNKWSYLQTRYFKNNTQPLYVLMSPDGELLSAPVGYTPDATEYAAFLNCGLSAYHEKLQEENRLGLKQD